MNRVWVAGLVMALSAVAWAGETRDRDIQRIHHAAVILDEIMAAPDKGIPEEILNDAKCVAVVPAMMKGGFIVGGEYGKGVASCRTQNGWSAPAFFQVAGGSFGLQIGGQEADLVLIIMNDHGMQHLLSSKFKLGANASAAAGPVGRHAEADTDWRMRAEVLTYSRARGVFAGISLNGDEINQNKDDTRAFYGRMVPFRTILTGKIASPAEAEPFLSTLNKYAPAGRVTPPKAAESQPKGPSSQPK
ncbi:MAG TPA: lipid-binding SYLF domain-containing protein [Terriglobales bacterium]|nr:lipid-binding SYLF domain-containing protein [Terriglobales bacterium]